MRWLPAICLAWTVRVSTYVNRQAIDHNYHWEQSEYRSLPMTSFEDQWLRDNARSMLNALVDAVFVIDSYGQIKFMNDAAPSMFGCTEDELLLQPVSVLMPEPYRTEHQSYVERYLAEGDALVLGSIRELPAQAQDGRLFPVSLKISEVVVAEEPWFVGIVRDLSESATMQHSLVTQREQFAQINRLSTLGEMTANIAHEINQPLAAIALYAQASRRLLDRDVVDELLLVNALDRLNEQTLRAGAVIERVQNFKRSNSGVKRPSSLNQVLEDVQPLVVADVKASGIELELNLPQPSPIVVCDPLQIQQVLINLVRNAVDAMLDIDCRYGRVICIDCDDSTPGIVAVNVADRGPGVAEALVKSIFDVFQTTKVMGTGMGLAVSRSMIEQHDGTLSYRNNSQWGAVFTFRLPVLESP